MPFAMREYGTPERIRTDNGPPFATTRYWVLAVYRVLFKSTGYGQKFAVRRIRHNGDVKIGGASVYVSEALEDVLVGLLQTEEDLFEIYFCDLLLGEVDTYSKTFTRVR